MPSLTNERPKVFICYSHRDKKHFDQLWIHLAPVRRQGKIDVWADINILAGQEWREQIRQALASAKVAIVLVSAYFRDSTFIAESELPPLLAAAKSEGVLIIPVVVGACDFNSSELAGIQAVNNPSRPLNGMNLNKRDEVWVEVVKRVERTLMMPDKLASPSFSTPQVIPQVDVALSGYVNLSDQLTISEDLTISEQPASPSSRAAEDAAWSRLAEWQTALANVTAMDAEDVQRLAKARDSAAILAARTVRRWSMDAQIVLMLLVEDGYPTDYIPLEAIQSGTLLKDEELLDALCELRDAGLIEARGASGSPFALVKPHVAAWLALDPELLGYDTNEDMVKVARCIKQHLRVDAQSLEKETQLPIKRLNIAALLLQADGIVDLMFAFGSQPYAFTSAIATYKTRRFLSDHALKDERPRRSVDLDAD